MDSIDNAPPTVKIPDHPWWCRAEVEELLDFDKSCDGVHHGMPVYAEAQSFDICISLGLVQFDEDAGSPRRVPGEPRIEIALRSRAMHESCSAALDLDEARQLALAIEHAVRDLERVHDCASDPVPSEWNLSWALGWKPEAQR